MCFRRQGEREACPTISDICCPRRLLPPPFLCALCQRSHAGASTRRCFRFLRFFYFVLSFSEQPSPASVQRRSSLPGLLLHDRWRRRGCQPQRALSEEDELGSRPSAVSSMPLWRIGDRSNMRSGVLSAHSFMLRWAVYSSFCV